jgi:hypothetical protein
MPHFCGIALHLRRHGNQQRLPSFLLAFFKTHFRQHELNQNSLDRRVQFAAPEFVVLANLHQYLYGASFAFMLFCAAPAPLKCA